MNTPIFRQGSCTVISYGAHHHELHWHHKFVANFRSFRDAVRYLFNEFSP